MALSLKQKLTVLPLLFYWPAIFILMHIPIPEKILVNIHYTSDKTLHYFAYLILVFLLWFAVSPYKKVNWRRATVWWVLLMVIVYGAIDEWLQGYFRRDPDIMDFVADSAAGLTVLIILSIFHFWTSFLVLTGAAIFILTNFIQVSLAGELSLLDASFHLFAYVIFSLLWIRYMFDLAPVRAPQAKWLIGAFVMPVLFLFGVELFSVVAGNGFVFQNIVISFIGISAVVLTIFFTALIRQKFTHKSSSSDF